MQLGLSNHTSHKVKLPSGLKHPQHDHWPSVVIAVDYVNYTEAISSHVIVLTCLPLSTVRTTSSSYLGWIECIPSDISGRQGDLPFTERGIGQQQRGPGGRRKEEGGGREEERGGSGKEGRRKGGGRRRKGGGRGRKGGGRGEEGERKGRGMREPVTQAWCQLTVQLYDKLQVAAMMLFCNTFDPWYCCSVHQDKASCSMLDTYPHGNTETPPTVKTKLTHELAWTLYLPVQYILSQGYLLVSCGGGGGGCEGVLVGVWGGGGGAALRQTGSIE